MSYPISDLRENCYASHFAEIAISRYYEIVDCFIKYKNNEDKSKITSEIRDVYKNLIESCIFSEMAIESFLNDYAAACLGDELYYEGYDRLSVIGKLQLIVQFLFQKNFNKTDSYFLLLKSLTKERNKLVHNKSTFVRPEVLQKIEECCKNHVECDFDLEGYYEDVLLEIKKTMDQSKGYIKTMVAIAKLFYENDEQFHPFSNMFGGIISLFGKVKAKEFAKEFNFKWEEGILGL